MAAEKVKGRDDVVETYSSSSSSSSLGRAWSSSSSLSSSSCLRVLGAIVLKMRRRISYR